MEQRILSGRTIGEIVRDFRMANGLSRRELSVRSGISYFTLSKVERDGLSLNYNQIQQICARLGVSVEGFLENRNHYANCRRSIGRVENAPVKFGRSGTSRFLCQELLRKRMTPVLRKILSDSLEACGGIVSYGGEMFVYVISGTLIVHTEFYSACDLGAGEAIYLGRGMGHALVRGKESAEVTALCMLADLDANADRLPDDLVLADH
jgi:transcriptional regulator with XRE-family HTH domain